MTETEVGVPAPLDRAIAMFREVVPAGSGGDPQEIREGFEAMLARLPIPDDAVIAAGSLGDVKGYWVHAPGAVSERVGVMFHGGGYIMGSAKGYRAYAAEISRVTNSRVFVADYRLAPEHLQPLHDWVAKYERAINDRLDRIEDYLEELQRQGEGSGT